jgi:hypothetical protein
VGLYQYSKPQEYEGIDVLVCNGDAKKTLGFQATANQVNRF